MHFPATQFYHRNEVKRMHYPINSNTLILCGFTADEAGTFSHVFNAAYYDGLAKRPRRPYCKHLGDGSADGDVFFCTIESICKRAYEAGLAIAGGTA